MLCLLEEGTGMDVTAGSPSVSSSSEPVPHTETSAGISNGFGTQYFDL